ncbi:MAG: YcfL family protein [Verrucomicrobiales bacterium]|nr:YcfL family protein [Verrucomicrobiales bacterium]
MKKQILLALLAAGSVAGLLAVSGCKTSVNSVENAQKEGQRQMVSDSRVITDGSLAKKVSIVGVNQTMTPGGLLKVQVELLNKTRSYQAFNYRFEWFDASGMQMNSLSTAVIGSTIEGKESKFISAVAPTSACKDFRLKLVEN